LFDVTVWNLSNGIRTTITINCGDYEINFFDGKQKFTSDVLCIEQLTNNEIRKMVAYQKKESFEEGKRYKINEIRGCLEI